VFFTARFQAGVRAWLADVTARGGWAGGAAIWLGTALQPSSPFDTPWRRDKGALWDLGPHVVSLLWASLGPVTSVTAEAGPADVSNLILRHESGGGREARGREMQTGASSTVTVTLSAPEAAEYSELYLWGEAGRSAVPREADQPVIPLRTALTELANNARSGRVSHDCDVRFGYAVWRVLADAERQIDARRPPDKG
jgi:predicted dehydrogenase